MFNQNTFLKVVEDNIVEKYPWAANKEKLANYMESVRKTLNGERTVLIQNASLALAWKAIGGTGPVTYKKLHSIPADDKVPHG